MVPSPLFLSLSDDLHGPPFQRSSASTIEYMDSYQENKKCKDGAKIQFSAVFALCAKIGLRDRPRTRAHLLQVRGLIRSSGAPCTMTILTASRG
jgi:hypothetical protein